jgi:hypothetical protein
MKSESESIGETIACAIERMPPKEGHRCIVILANAWVERPRRTNASLDVVITLIREWIER